MKPAGEKKKKRYKKDKDGSRILTGVGVGEQTVRQRHLERNTDRHPAGRPMQTRLNKMSGSQSLTTFKTL